MKKILIAFFISIFTLTISTNAKLTQPQKNLTIDYTVQSGDTLYKIAHEHHTTIKEVLEVNGLDKNVVIKVGQSLKIPLNTYSPSIAENKNVAVAPSPATIKPVPNADTGMTSYKIQNGDTLFSIARSHHISIGALMQANNMDMKSVIKVGQSLMIPQNGYLPTKKIQTRTASNANGTQAVPPPGTNKAKRVYVVKKGDTLFSIARKNHIVISKLMKLNNIGLGDALKTGQLLRVSSKGNYVGRRETPKKEAKTEKKKELPAGAMPSYTVKKGDTLWEIARKHHLTLKEIRKLNKMSKKERIHTGMVLAVGKAVQPKPELYIVKKGDTLWLIAKKNKMSTKKLRRINKMKRKDRIHTGMVIALTKEAYPVKIKMDKKIMIAKLEERGATKSEIKKALAKVKKFRRLAQTKKEEKRVIKTPLRVARKKKRKNKKSRFSSAASILNGDSGGSSSRGYGRNSRVIRVAKRYLGRRYVWGAEGPRSFDCSGFTQYVMRKSKGVQLPRISRKQAYYGKYVSRSHLRPGDLIFFDTSRRRRGYVNHVGIYIGNNKFIHASSARHRVIITSLNRPFYRARFKWGRRIN